MESSSITTSRLCSARRLAFSITIFRYLYVTAGRFVEGAGNDLAAYRTCHLGHLFRPLVDEEHDEIALLVIRHDRMGDALQHHRLARFRGRDDERALPLADRRDQVDDPRREIFGASVAPFEMQALARKERGEVLEQHLVLRSIGAVVVDGVDLEKREVAFPFLWRTNLARDGVAGAQAESSNLARTDVDVVRTGEVGAVGRAQETEAVLQDLEHPVSVDVFAPSRVTLEDGEDDVLLALTGHAVDAHLLRELEKLRRGHLLQFGKVHEFRVDEVALVQRLGIEWMRTNANALDARRLTLVLCCGAIGVFGASSGFNSAAYMVSKLSRCFGTVHPNRTEANRRRTPMARCPGAPSAFVDSDVAVEKCRELGFREGADLRRFDVAVLEEHQGRNASDTVLRRG